MVFEVAVAWAAGACLHTLAKLHCAINLQQPELRAILLGASRSGHLLLAMKQQSCQVVATVR
jgi:hypothetical protein